MLLIPRLSNMSRLTTVHHHRRRTILLVFLTTILAQLVQTCNGDVGTALSYTPPYLPTACYGEDTTEFPANNLFAAAGEGIWDNGAACGRQYLVRCISTDAQRQGISCIEDTTVQIKIVDFANNNNNLPPGITMVLSETAFEAIAHQSSMVATSSSSSSSINIEFTQV